MPVVEVVGLGPAGPDLLTRETAELLDRAAGSRPPGESGGAPVFLRTRRHPAAAVVSAAGSFDHHYEHRSSFDEVYDAIVCDLLSAAHRTGHVLYAVPGSPSVAERTVELLRRDPCVEAGEVEVRVHAALSFLDLAVARLGVDPVGAGVRLVDGLSFGIEAAGSRGPLVVAQCSDRSVLSAIKLAPEVEPPEPVTVLYHLGLPDERVWEVRWEELDRSFEPDHLTSLWIPVLDAPVAAELVRLDELVRILRERCPWDRRQTHGSLRRHLLEEAYEVLDVLDEVAATEAARPGGSAPARAPAESEKKAFGDLEEELGDLLFQVFLHARLAAEAGRFTLADVARAVHDKLVARHPHVFGDDAAATAEDVMASWEVRKLAEKRRALVTDGIPDALPALAMAAKLQRKAAAIGMALPDVAEEAERVASAVAHLGTEGGGSVGGTVESAAEGPVVGGDEVAAGSGDGPSRRSAEPPSTAERTVGDALFALASIARALGIDPESALRSRLAGYRQELEAQRPAPADAD